MSKTDPTTLIEPGLVNTKSVLGVAGRVLGVASAVNDIINISNKGVGNASAADWIKLGVSVGQIALKSNPWTIGLSLAYGVADVTGHNPIDAVYDSINK